MPSTPPQIRRIDVETIVETIAATPLRILHTIAWSVGVQGGVDVAAMLMSTFMHWMGRQMVQSTFPSGAHTSNCLLDEEPTHSSCSQQESGSVRHQWFFPTEAGLALS
eukprot:1111783-Amphidinium_carterae.1